MAGKFVSQGDVLRALHRGDMLMKLRVNDPSSSAKTIYRLGDNEIVRADLVARMVKERLLMPNNDGLFGDTQTYRLARGEELESP